MKTTTKNNIMIAEFMGAEIKSPKTKFSMVQYPTDVTTTTKGQHKETYKQLVHSKNLEYDTSWNWLMPVVEKIYSYIFTDNGDRSYVRTFGMINDENNQFMFRFNRGQLHQSDSLITAAYSAVCEFIEWYNLNK